MLQFRSFLQFFNMHMYEESGKTVDNIVVIIKTVVKAGAVGLLHYIMFQRKEGDLKIYIIIKFRN